MVRGGGAIANLVQSKLPAGTTIEVLARGGGIANPVVTNENKTQIAFSNVATAAWAWMGEEEIYKGKKHQDIRALVGGINSVYVVAMLREDYIKKTGNDTLEKALADKNLRVIMKPAGSSVPPVARMIAQSLGTSVDAIRKDGRLIQVDAAQTTSMLRDGRADLYFETAAKGHPAVTEVTLDRRHAVRRPAAEDARRAGEKRTEAVADAAVVQGPERPDQGGRPRHADHRQQGRCPTTSPTSSPRPSSRTRPSWSRRIRRSANSCRRTPGSLKTPRSRCIPARSAIIASAAG